MNVSPVLENKNRCERDTKIKFYARGHKYEILTDLKFPKKIIEKVTKLVRWHMFFNT